MRLASICQIAACLALSTAASAVASPAQRPVATPGRPIQVSRPFQTTGIQVQEAGLAQLLQCLLGPGVQVSNATLTAAPSAAGLFTGGALILGIDQGIVLTSGNITTLVGPNLSDNTSFDNNLPGDPDLDALIPGYKTYDATILEFDFSCQNPASVSFQYVFGSEEYNEWVGSPYNDVFGFFLNGINIAAVPALCSNGGIPVAINNVDCQYPFSPPNGPNCDCYRNNALPEGGGSINTELDGLTQVFYATGQIQPGVNHMKIAIADAGDHILDSAVMIRCQTFVCAAAPSIGGCCEGTECFLKSQQECQDDHGTYLGDGVPCATPSCATTPAKAKSWGQIRRMYR